MTSTDLYTLGWNAGWTSQQPDQAPDARPARVVRVDRGAWRVHDGREVMTARLLGRLRGEPPPVVGDWVWIEGDPPAIVATLTRRSSLERKAPGKATRSQVLAANLDHALLVCGLDRDQGIRSLERLIALCLDGGVAPVVVLNKLDLCENPEDAVARAQQAAPAAPRVMCSATSGQGLEALAPWLQPGRTLCLLGPSGVGKSTLVNALLGRREVAVGEVRASDRRGRHTTTARQLHVLPSGALLIDTPGMRELGLWIQGEDSDLGFDTIASLARRCRFNDCQHDGEPGCAVAEALADGRLAPERFLRFLELRQEEAALRERKRAANSKRRFKGISKEVRRMKKRGWDKA